MFKKRQSQSMTKRLRPALISALVLSMFSLASYYITSPPAVRATSSTIVISQVYGGGGNSGATLRNDFIELFNRGTTPVSLSGWSVQYASTTGTSWQKTDLTAVTLQPGQYYLVQEAQGAGGTTNLPTPDATGAIAMSATAGKVALVNNQTLITSGTSCPTGASIIDFVGFGTGTNCFEGTGPTASLSNTTAALRGMSGCTETDNNPTDFAVGAPNPRNTASPLNPCNGPPALLINDAMVIEGNSGTVTATFTVSLNSPAPVGGVTFDISTQNNSATIADNDYVMKSLTGQTIPFNSQTYTFEVTVNGDMTFEPNETFFVNVTNVSGATVADGTGVGTITNDDCPPPPADIVISQVYGGGGNAGATFTHDFIELFNQGPTTVNLSGWSVQYNSANGAGTWSVTALSGSIVPGGYYLVQEAQGNAGTTPLPTPDTFGTIAMSGTAGKVALSSSTIALSGSCPTCLVDLVGYGDASCFEGAGPTSGLTNTTAALRKRGGCFDSNNNNVDFSTGSPTPRNTASATNNCTPLALPIHDIQGNGAASPFAGQLVSTTGIVTARKSNGFFLQDLAVNYDADPATSEALFVFTSSAPTVAVGDGVTAVGTASEFFDLTQIESTLPGDVTINTSSNPLPVAVVLTMSILDPAGSPDQLERFEGMRMHADLLRSVAPTNEFGETFTVLDGVARPIREPGIEISQPVPPDPTSGMVDCCIPRWDENPERIMIDSDGLLGSSPISVTSNVTLSNVTGPLDFTFSDYKVLPETPPATSANMSAVPVPAPLPGEFTVAGYNIENFSNNATQRQKAALAIRTVMRYPDVIGHVEILNLASLQALADQVNNDAVAAGDPNPAYVAYLIQAPAGGTQNVGFLVKTSRVQVDSVTQERATDTYINPITGLPENLHDRPPLVLKATVDPTGPNARKVIIVVNHLRSFIDIELVGGDGPRVRAKRKAQAEAVAELLQDLQTNNPGTPVISVGDYNSYQFNDGYTDPIATLKGTPTPDDQLVVDESPDLVNPNFINLTDSLPADQRYSFIFEGTPQAIDHVLVNTVAYSYLQRYAIARNNADFPEAPASLFASDTSRPERNSDHDMPVAYFLLPPSANLAITKMASPSTVTTGSNVTYTIAVTNNGTSTAQNVVVADNLPSSVTFVSCNATGGGVCAGSGNNRTVTYSSLASGASETVTFVASVNCSVANGQMISNTAMVSSTTDDPDASDNSAMATVTASNPPPVISGVSATPSVLGPPNHKLVDVTVNYTTSDNCGPVNCTLSVTSNEPVNGSDDGDTSPDWIVVDAHNVKLRAERSGTGTGRIYTITITCTDAGGNTTTTSVTVTVPLN